MVIIVYNTGKSYNKGLAYLMLVMYRKKTKGLAEPPKVEVIHEDSVSF